MKCIGLLPVQDDRSCAATTKRPTSSAAPPPPHGDDGYCVYGFLEGDAMRRSGQYVTNGLTIVSYRLRFLSLPPWSHQGRAASLLPMTDEKELMQKCRECSRLSQQQRQSHHDKTTRTSAIAPLALRIGNNIEAHHCYL